MTPKIVTRFAPSPTGYLHVGGARTALFNWLLARHAGGAFLLRIEDTDLARSTQDAVDQLLDDLRWLGLQWDNAELVYQSKRLATYNKLIDQLIAAGKAYEAWETPEELDALRKEAEKAKRSFIYRRRLYSDDEVKRFRDEGRKSVVRFVMPVQEYRFTDVVLGKEIVQPAAECQDFVIRKTDGMPTYHFGVVVDDAEMNVTHVLRGLEHLKNTFNHISLQEALGYPRPTYAHLSVMLNPETGEKLSKRDRDRRIRKRTMEWMRNTRKTVGDLASASGLAEARLKDWLDIDTKQLDLSEQPAVMRIVGLKETDLPEIMIHDFRKAGYLPEALNNFLALQGFSPGNDLEQMSMDKMTELFALDRINSSNPRFNREKLLNFNTEFCAAAPMERLVSAMRSYLAANPTSPLNRATDEQLARVIGMKKGFRTLRQVDEASGFLFQADEQIAFDPDAVEKVLKKNDQQGFKVLRDLLPLLQAVQNWAHADIESAVNGYCAASGLGLGKVAQPIRVAVTGSTVSPPIFESLEMLGKASTLARVERCVAF